MYSVSFEFGLPGRGSLHVLGPIQLDGRSTPSGCVKGSTQDFAGDALYCRAPYAHTYIRTYVQTHLHVYEGKARKVITREGAAAIMMAANERIRPPDDAVLAHAPALWSRNHVHMRVPARVPPERARNCPGNVCPRHRVAAEQVTTVIPYLTSSGRDRERSGVERACLSARYANYSTAVTTFQRRLFVGRRWLWGGFWLLRRFTDSGVDSTACLAARIRLDLSDGPCFFFFLFASVSLGPYESRGIACTVAECNFVR